MEFVFGALVIFGAGVFIGRWTRSNSSTGKSVETAANSVIDGVKDAVKEVKKI